MNFHVIWYKDSWTFMLYQKLELQIGANFCAIKNDVSDSNDGTY